MTAFRHVSLHTTQEESDLHEQATSEAGGPVPERRGCKCPESSLQEAAHTAKVGFGFFFGTKTNTNKRSFNRTILLYTLAIYVGASAYSSIVLDPLERAAVDALQHLPNEEFEEEPPPLFIPFPGTTKQLKPVPYRGSDPEWQEFVKFSKDKKLAQKVRGTGLFRSSQPACH